MRHKCVHPLFQDLSGLTQNFSKSILKIGGFTKTNIRKWIIILTGMVSELPGSDMDETFPPSFLKYCDAYAVQVFSCSIFVFHLRSSASILHFTRLQNSSLCYRKTITLYYNYTVTHKIQHTLMYTYVCVMVMKIRRMHTNTSIC